MPDSNTELLDGIVLKASLEGREAPVALSTWFAGASPI